MESGYMQNMYKMLLYTALFSIYYIFFLNQGLSSQGILGHFPSDLETHIGLSKIIQKMGISFSKDDFDPLFHLLVFICARGIKALGQGENESFILSAALVLSSAKLIQFLIIKFIVNKTTDLSEGKQLFFTIVINFCAALFLPLANTYLPFGAPNIFHNPTFILLSPFAIIFFYFYFSSYLDESPKNFRLSLLLAALLILCTLSKPSFTNVILLVIAGLYIFKPRRFLSKYFLHDLIIFLPSGILLIIQIYLMSKNPNVGGLAFAPFEVMNYSSRHHFLSLFKAFEFPLLITVLCSFQEKKYSRNNLLFAWIFTLIAYLIFILFTTKYSPSHANLIWSCNLGLTLLYMYVIIDFANFLIRTEEKIFYRWGFFKFNLEKKYIVNICAINLSLIFLSGLNRFIAAFLGGGYA